MVKLWRQSERRVLESPGWSSLTTEDWGRIKAARAGLGSGHSSIRGLYSGGTLCYEALLLLRGLGHQVRSNVETPVLDKPGTLEGSPWHILTDLGDDRYTVGRPHPMIDFRLRCNFLTEAAADPEVGVVLMDVVLGHGAHPDPAKELVPALGEARRIALAAGRGLACVVAICGVPDDPQNPARQEAMLVDAGAVVVHSNAMAARIASALSTGNLGALPRR